jgi:hypothetical protein
MGENLKEDQNLSNFFHGYCESISLFTEDTVLIPHKKMTIVSITSTVP